jgi:predicted Rossmann fold nucleotide-binding protein DprA/Smf involved in DNA uptake
MVSLEKEIEFLGNRHWLGIPLLAIFSSAKCPASSILKAHDYARDIQNCGTGVISGFQSPVEKEMLAVLLKGNSPLVICPARGLTGMRIPRDWQTKLDKGQLLVLSGFPASVKRPTRETVQIRNHLVARLASEVLIVHAEPEGKVASLVKEIQEDKKIHFL